LKAGESRALGIIETAGRAPLIEAVDNAIKAAAVTLKSSYFVGGGVNTVTLVGDVGAMRAALDAAKAAFQRMGVVGQTHLIPRVAEDVWSLIIDQTNGRDTPPPKDSFGPVKPGMAAKKSAHPPAKPPVLAEDSVSARTVVPSVLVETNVSGEPPVTVLPPEKKDESGEEGETLFSDEISRPGEKVSGLKKTGDGVSPGKSSRKRNPKSKS
jgi:microcompartment protein CcmL/EutN